MGDTTQEVAMERKGAAYGIKATRPGGDPNAHAQVTQASYEPERESLYSGWRKPDGSMMTPEEENEEEDSWGIHNG
jgi:hypothetical protein